MITYPDPTRKAGRNVQVQQAYDEHRIKLRALHGDNSPPCPFCQIAGHVVVEELETMLIVENYYPYEYFDDLRVKRHLLLIPKRHLNYFYEFTDQEMSEYNSLTIKYHDQGYSQMTRAVGDASRSVHDHMHTNQILYYGEADKP